MPTYDFRCGGCRKKYTVTLSITDRDRKRIKCPKCGSSKAETIFTSFFAKTSRKISRKDLAQRPRQFLTNLRTAPWD